MELAPLAFEALVDIVPAGPAPAGGDDAGSGHEHSGPWPHTPSHVPRFEPLFVDLQSLPDEELYGGVRTVVALLFLKYLAET